MKWFKRLFPDYSKLPKSGKFLAWLTFLQGTHWLGGLLLQQVIAPETLRWWTVLLMLAVAALTLASSWHAFKYRVLGFKLMLIVFVLGLFKIQFANGAFIDLAGVLSFSISWYTNGVGWGINLLGILFLWLTAKNIGHFTYEAAKKRYADIPEAE